MVFDGTQNNMQSRAIPAIALKPSNEHGGSYFMSLMTSKKLHSYQWTELPIPNKVINRVHELAEEENQPLLHNGVPIFEWEYDILVIDVDTKDSAESEERDQEIYTNNDNTAAAHTNNINNTSDIEEEQNRTINCKEGNVESDNEESLMMDDESLPWDPQQHSMDGFFDEEFQARSVSGETPTAENISTSYEQDNNNNFERINKENIKKNNEHNEITNSIIDENKNNELIDDETGNDEGGQLKDNNENEVQPRQSHRSNLSQIGRMVMGHGGKDYCSYRLKQLAQILHKKRLERKSLKSQVTLFMRKKREMNGSHHMFFQAALKVLFLSPQMNTRKGIKKFGERVIAAMIKEFTQLDQGAFLGKAVVEPVDYDSLTEEEIRMAMDTINLIKEKRGGTVKGCTCANGSRQCKYLKQDKLVASPTVSNEGMLGSFLIDAYERQEMGVFDIPGAYLHTEMEHKDDHRILLVLHNEFVDMMCEVNPKYIPFVMAGKSYT